MLTLERSVAISVKQETVRFQAMASHCLEPVSSNIEISMFAGMAWHGSRHTVAGKDRRHDAQYIDSTAAFFTASMRMKRFTLSPTAGSMESMPNSERLMVVVALTVTWSRKPLSASSSTTST